MSGPMLGRLGVGTRLGGSLSSFVGAVYGDGTTGGTPSPKTLSEPVGTQPGDLMVVLLFGGESNGQAGDQATMPTGWTKYATAGVTTLNAHYVLTRVRGASAPGTLVMAGVKSAPVDGTCTLGAFHGGWASFRPAVIRGGGSGNRTAPTSTFTGGKYHYPLPSVTGAGAVLEVVGLIGDSLPVFDEEPGFTKHFQSVSTGGQGGFAWFSRENPPSPTGITTFDASSTPSFDAHILV